MNLKLKNLGLFTSGGDSPGMNPCIRAIVETCTHDKIGCYGFQRGYLGVIEGKGNWFGTENLDHLMGKGGTILKSDRCEEFYTKAGRKKAADTIKGLKIDALIVIGGDGSFAGANLLETEHGIKTIGIPGTIDNDLFGTDYTLGYDSALNTIVECIDKIRDTAESHNRLFIVEVMGKDAGFLALRSGIASAASAILIPEIKSDVNALVKHLKQQKKMGHHSQILVLAEGDDAGGAYPLGQELKSALPDFEIRISVLGHLQRGGSPSAYDRLLGTELGLAAVENLKKGNSNCMVGKVANEIVCTPFDRAIKHHQKLSPHLLTIASKLGINC